ncbi:unnamed protein product [Linum trigynum]|uniref:Uncharacterized protein n=1 Tax=Linum trigynum TaxID=586398 RepID=A0AAV2FCH9_9ROSI
MIVVRKFVNEDCLGRGVRCDDDRYSDSTSFSSSPFASHTESPPPRCFPHLLQQQSSKIEREQEEQAPARLRMRKT